MLQARMKRTMACVVALILGCAPRPTPTGSGAPIGPRPVSEIEALIGERGLSIQRTVAFGFEDESELAGFYITPSPHWARPGRRSRWLPSPA